jgi:hypothetical protein
LKEEGREDYGPSRKHKEEVGVGDNTRGAGEGGGGRRKCGGNKQGLNDKEIMATVLLPSTHTQKQAKFYLHTCVYDVKAARRYHFRQVVF